MTACEGGIGYWSRCSDYKPGFDRDLRQVKAATVTVTECDSDDNWKPCAEPVKVTTASIDAAIKKILTHKASIEVGGKFRKLLAGAVQELDAGDLDASDCDVIMQVAVLGNVVYG